MVMYTKKIKKFLTHTILFLLASVWTACGVYLAVDVVIENQSIKNLAHLLEVLLFVNIGVYLTYIGIKSHMMLYRETIK